MKKQDRSSTEAMIIGGGIGAVVAGALGALLWSSHRLLGFLVGAAVVGVPTGATVGYLISASDVKKGKELPTDGRPAPGWSQPRVDWTKPQYDDAGNRLNPTPTAAAKVPLKKEDQMQPLNLMAMP